MTSLSDFEIKVFQEEDGSYYAEVVNLPGCFTAWDTLEELSLNLKEAVESYVLSLQKDLPNFHFHITPKELVNA